MWLKNNGDKVIFYANNSFWIDFWLIFQLFEQVVYIILIHIGALKHTSILPWCNNETGVPISDCFRIYLGDLENNFFGIIIPLYFCFIKNMIILSNIFVFLLKEHNENQTSARILQNWNHTSKALCMISCCSVYWIN